MKYIDWNVEKNEKLKKERGIGFDEIVEAMFGDGLVRVEDHPNITKYGHQQVIVVNIGDYIYLTPFVSDRKKWFLKTIFPSRKATRKWCRKGGV